MSGSRASDGGLIDLRAMRDVAADCEWTLLELGRFYVNGTRKELRKLERALASGSAADLIRLAHGCAGASGTCGVRGLATLFQQLELAGREGRFDAAAPLLAQARRRLGEVLEILERQDHTSA